MSEREPRFVIVAACSTVRIAFVCAGIAFLGVIGCSATPARLNDGSQRFEVLDDAMVRDRQTGLLWARNANLADVRDAWGGLTWPQANDFVAKMSDGSQPAGDCAAWRLPTAVELDGLLTAFIASRSVFVAELASRDIDQVDWLRNLTVPFTGYAETAYWSRTEAVRAAPEAAGPDDPVAYALAVDTSGTVFALPKSATKRVWPICASRSASSEGPAVH